MKQTPMTVRSVIGPARGRIVTPFEKRRPFRLWMTGSLAVVMAALIPMRDATESERQTLWRTLRHSRYTVGETVQRIEASARGHGLPLLAVLPGERPLLVLSSSVGGTLAVMDEAHSTPAMPLSLMVCGRAGGGADVMVCADPAAQTHGAWTEVPSQVLAEVRSLPGLVANALA